MGVAGLVPAENLSSHPGEDNESPPAPVTDPVSFLFLIKFIPECARGGDKETNNLTMTLQIVADLRSPEPEPDTTQAGADWTIFTINFPGDIWSTRAGRIS